VTHGTPTGLDGHGHRRVLVLGGARSGKSAFAETMLSAHSAVQYVATSPRPAGDPEWDRRVAEHRGRRPLTWTTLEAPLGTDRPVLDLAAVCADDRGPAALVDSITAWLTSVLDRHGAWAAESDLGTRGPAGTAGSAGAAGPAVTDWRPAVAAELDLLVRAWQDSHRHVVAVTDEVGGGIVPASAAGRLFRDQLGLLNQRLAATADEVWQVVAGIPCRLR
jgi:adenosylcobinamide kinase/adenosylcobinamide-phosphate guanylyltransferase